MLNVCFFSAVVNTFTSVKFQSGVLFFSRMPALNCIVLFVLVLVSFSHGYSATLAAKLMIKLDLT